MVRKSQDMISTKKSCWNLRKCFILQI